MSARWTSEVMASARAYRLILRDGKIVAMDVEPRAAEFLVSAANLVDEMARNVSADDEATGPYGIAMLVEAEEKACCIKANDAPEYPEGRER